MAQATITDQANLPMTAVGLQAMQSGTSVLTLDGELPVEFLSVGDRILTRNGARRLRQIEVTVIQNARMVRISKDALGVGRPCGDVMLSADQQILIRDWRAKALYGSAQAMVPASRLADGEYIRSEIIREVRLYTLGFHDDAVIYAGGLELACGKVTVEA